MFQIDKEKCVHCGLCIKDCSANALEFDENKFPVINEKKCFKCQHCLAICPTGALSVCDKHPENSQEIFQHDSENLLNLIKSRRSVRHYKQENLDSDRLEKLKSILKYVPTGCNDHRLHFSFIDDIKVMNEFRGYVNSKIMEALTKKTIKPLAEKFGGYTKRFLAGEDIIFRTAPHIVVVSTPKDAPCQNIDPTIALSYFELYAQSMGVGTCWCGLGEFCLMAMPELSEYLEVPKGYKAAYMMLFGEPENKYSRTVQPEEIGIVSVQKGEFKKFGFIDRIKKIFFEK